MDSAPGVLGTNYNFIIIINNYPISFSNESEEWNERIEGKRKREGAGYASSPSLRSTQQVKKLVTRWVHFSFYTARTALVINSVASPFLFLLPRRCESANLRVPFAWAKDKDKGHVRRTDGRTDRQMAHDGLTLSLAH